MPTVSFLTHYTVGMANIESGVVFVKRSRAYCRKQMLKHINRKVYIFTKIWRNEKLYVPAHYYSKNKVHCSCPMCRRKSYDYPKLSDLRKKVGMDYQLKEFFE